jgi:hypothetical protein
MAATVVHRYKSATNSPSRRLRCLIGSLNKWGENSNKSVAAVIVAQPIKVLETRRKTLRQVSGTETRDAQLINIGHGLFPMMW